jgi:ubiquitin-like 1-activating enzyme E1 B
MDAPDFAECIFEKVFKRDIDRLLSMEDMWKSRAPPMPLDYSKIAEEAKDLGPEVAQEDQKKWSLAQNYVVFADSVNRLALRMRRLKEITKEGDALPIMSFDKDDEDILDFVAAGANLRSCVFAIELKSKFDIKREDSSINTSTGQPLTPWQRWLETLFRQLPPQTQSLPVCVFFKPSKFSAMISNWAVW